LDGWAAPYIHPLAEEGGVVMVATDWIGLSEADLPLLLELIGGDMNRIAMVTDRLQQSLINNLTMTETTIAGLAIDEAIWDQPYPLIDESRVYYYGVSLGGIQGSSFVSISNRVTRGVMAVPGAVWLNMIPRSTNWTMIKLVLDIYYPDPLIQQLGIALFQQMFDLSDPINLTRMMFQQPPPGSPPERVVLLQESIGDCQVPNMTTDMLGRALGINEIQPDTYDVPGMPYTSSPTTQSAFTQYYLVEQVQANPPPPENVPPDVDNGAHSDMVFLPNALDQVMHFLDTGEIVQYCDGSCDPD
jgi:hypothetical protein